jgi:hypothetical protein
MISLDWIERLKKDTIDFYKRKLPAKDYDIDIIYNAYPERIDNKIPQVVITYVGKTLAVLLAKEADKYTEFYDYLLAKKGENGKIIFTNIMARVIQKKPAFFLQYIETVLFKLTEQKDCNLITDKALLPFIKKNPELHLDLLSKWIKKDNPIVTESIQKMLIKLVTTNKELIKPLFQKLETHWLYATENMKKLNISLLKTVQKLDAEFYYQLYERYRFTRNPIFAEILCHAMIECNQNMVEMVENWCKSGNVNLKKIGLHGKKIVNKTRK